MNHEETNPQYWFIYDKDWNIEHIYGKLYTWYTVDDHRNVCPVGWHVPDNKEWHTLINYLDDKMAGGKLMESGTSHWLSDNTGADNESGFSALPGGSRFDKAFGGIRMWGSWWSSTEDTDSEAWIGYMGYHLSIVPHWSHGKYYGASVRCIKNQDYENSYP